MEQNLFWTSHFKIRPSLLLEFSLNKLVVIIILDHIDFQCSVSNIRDNSFISHIQLIFLLLEHSLLIRVLLRLLGRLIALDLVEAYYLRLFHALVFFGCLCWSGCLISSSFLYFLFSSIISFLGVTSTTRTKWKRILNLSEVGKD